MRGDEMVQVHDECTWGARYCGLRSVSWSAATGWRVVPFRNCQASIRKFRGDNGIGINRDAAISKLMQNGQGIQGCFRMLFGAITPNPP
jgi:hypothetical protein